MSAARVADLYRRPGWPWLPADQAHVERLLAEVRGSPEALAWLGSQRDQGTPMLAELLLCETLQNSRHAAWSEDAAIIGIGWCRRGSAAGTATTGAAATGATAATAALAHDTLLYETLLEGGLLSETRWWTKEQIQERVLRTAAKGQQTGQHVIHDLETISSWMDEAARSRWEPSSFNKFLERRLGAEEADKIMRWASKSVTSQGPQGADTKRFEQQATRCRCLVAELLLGEYAALKSHGRNPASTNLQEDHTSRARMRFARDCRARRLTITLREPDAEKKKTGDDEGGRSASKRVRMAPAPKMADGQRIPARDAREVFDCVAWDQPGQLWCSHLHPEHELGVFETHPQAHVDARLCGFIRDELSESEHGRTVQNAYGGVLKIKIDKGEAAMQWAELNKDLLEELGRLELSRLDEGRRPYRLVAATDGSRKETKRRSINLAVADGGSTTVAPPRVASGVYYGQQPEGSAVPIAEGLALPAGYDINMAEHMALIVALRRHAALILEVSLDVLLEHLDAGREDELLPVLAPAEGTEELDLLVIMDSENVANSMGTAWEAQDLWLLRGETYGFRLEEALLLRRLIQRRGGLVDIARMSAHVGLTWNVYADAVAVAALQLDCAIEPRLRVTRALATITCKTGAGRTWQALTPEIWSAGELDGRVSLKVRAHVDQALRRKLIEKQVRVYTAAWGGSTLLQNLVPQACAHALDVTTCPRQGLLQVLTQDLTHLQMVGPELLEGRKYAMPIFDYDRTGHDPAAGHQAFDRPIVQALAVQAGGGFGNSTQLTRTGMRQVLRNFDQAAIAELSCRDIEDKHAAAGEALRISKCLACGDEVRCDVFHFLECRVGASIELKEAIDKILEQQILILNLPDVGSMEAGDADYLWELTWARVSLWFERLPGELGRYRRYQAARALSGMLSAPPDSIIAATASDWVASGRDRDKGGAGDEEEEEKDREDGDGIGDEHERTSKARKLARRYYVHRTVALNTLLIDHLKREYEIWLMRLTSGATALRASFGADYQAVARIDDIKLSLEYLTGTYLFADGRPSETMTKEEFDARRLTLDAGRFVYEISGETQSIRNDKGDQREQRIMERDSSKREQERQSMLQRCKHSKPEHERELGVIAERRLSRGFQNLHEPSEEEAAVLLDGGRARALTYMRDASAVGRMPWAKEATGIEDRLAASFTEDGCWWDAMAKLMSEAEEHESRSEEHRDAAVEDDEKAMSITPHGSSAASSPQASKDGDAAAGGSEGAMSITPRGSSVASSSQASPASAHSNLAAQEQDAASRGGCARQDAAQPPTSPTPSSPLMPPALQREARQSQRLSAEDIRALAETVAHLDFGTERSTADGTPEAPEEEEGDVHKEAKDDAVRSGSERAMSISPLGSLGALSAQASPAPAQSTRAAQEQDAVSPAPPPTSSPPAPPAPQRERQRERRSGFQRFSAEEIGGLTATIACLDFGIEPVIDGQAAEGTTAEAQAPTAEEATPASERASETSEQHQQPVAAMSASRGPVHDVHDVSADAEHAGHMAASSDGGVLSVPVQHDEGRSRDEGGSSIMEHGERIEGGNTRESGEGAERERGAGSDEEEAVESKEREGGQLTGAIKKKKSKRRAKNEKSHQQRRDVARPG